LWKLPADPRSKFTIERSRTKEIKARKVMKVTDKKRGKMISRSRSKPRIGTIKMLTALKG
jgi:hypothetical protein